MDDDDDVEDDEPEAEEETPAPRKSRRALKKADDLDEEGDEESAFDDSLISQGWKEAKKNRPKGDWTNDFIFTEDPRIVKFLTAEPWTYGQHWVQREGKKGFPCRGKGCPLCKVGIKVSQKYVFSVVDLGEDGAEPTVVNLQVGVKLADQLEAFNDDPKVGPLTKFYWAMSRAGKGLKTTYTVLPVKDRDLEEDWEFDLDAIEDFLDTAEAPTPEKAITWYSAERLKEIADEAMD